MQVGVSKKLAHLPLEISLSILDLNAPSENIGEVFERFAVGGEFKISEPLRLRIGYNHRVNKDFETLNESNFSGLSGGVGMFVKGFRIDYAYSNFNLIGNTHKFGFSGTF